MAAKDPPKVTQQLEKLSDALSYRKELNHQLAAALSKKDDLIQKLLNASIEKNEATIKEIAGFLAQSTEVYQYLDKPNQ